MIRLKGERGKNISVLAGELENRSKKGTAVLTVMSKDDLFGEGRDKGEKVGGKLACEPRGANRREGVRRRPR